MNLASEAKPPHLLWTLAEGRAIFELGSFNLLQGVLRRLPRGDRHGVLVLPGFMASDVSTKPLRRLLRDLGYDVYGWHLGRNDRFDLKREEALYARLRQVHRISGGQVSIIGWSLGGVFAREMAKQHPELVRQVITLGSPISNDRRHSAATHLFERLNGKRTKPELEGRYQNLDEAPPVPTTSIFTRTDGIVSWKGSVQKDGHQNENILVPASHFGLAVNPLVMVALADRLRQKPENWTPFSAKGWRKLFFARVRRG